MRRIQRSDLMDTLTPVGAVALRSADKDSTEPRRAARRTEAESEPEQGEERGQHEADEDGGHQGEVEREVPPAIDDVAGQAAERHLGPQAHQEADHEQDGAREDERASQVRHDSMLLQGWLPSGRSSQSGPRRSAGVPDARRRRSMMASLSGKAILVMVMPQPAGRPEVPADCTPFTQATRPTADIRQPSAKR